MPGRRTIYSFIPLNKNAIVGRVKYNFGFNLDLKPVTFLKRDSNTGFFLLISPNYFQEQPFYRTPPVAASGQIHEIKYRFFCEMLYS